jgi:hypothetical protein
VEVSQHNGSKANTSQTIFIWYPAASAQTKWLKHIEQCASTAPKSDGPIS